jgi:signal peptidase
MAPKQGRRRLVKDHGILCYLGTGLSLGLLAFVLLLAGLVVIVPAVSGSTPYTILTSSMEPGLPPGTLVIVKPIDPEAIKIGTVVTYQLDSGEPEVVTHRVIEIQGPTLPGADPSFITKGDANSEPDARPVMTVQVRGAVWYSVPYIGWVNNVVNGDLRSIVIPIVAGLLFLYAGWTIIGNQIDRRRRRERLEREEREEADRRARQRIADRAPDDARELAPSPAPTYFDAPPPDRFTPTP